MLYVLVVITAVTTYGPHQHTIHEQLGPFASVKECVEASTRLISAEPQDKVSRTYICVNTGRDK